LSLRRISFRCALAHFLIWVASPAFASSAEPAGSAAVTGPLHSQIPPAIHGQAVVPSAIFSKKSDKGGGGAASDTRNASGEAREDKKAENKQENSKRQDGERQKEGKEHQEDQGRQADEPRQDGRKEQQHKQDDEESLDGGDERQDKQDVDAQLERKENKNKKDGQEQEDRKEKNDDNDDEAQLEQDNEARSEPRERKNRNDGQGQVDREQKQEERDDEASLDGGEKQQHKQDVEAQPERKEKKNRKDGQEQQDRKEKKDNKDEEAEQDRKEEEQDERGDEAPQDREAEQEKQDDEAQQDRKEEQEDEETLDGGEKQQDQQDVEAQPERKEKKNRKDGQEQQDREAERDKQDDGAQQDDETQQYREERHDEQDDGAQQARKSKKDKKEKRRQGEDDADEKRDAAGSDDDENPAVAEEDAAEDVALGFVTLNWLPPTEYDDGTPLMDLAGFRILWRKVDEGDDQSIDVDDPGLSAIIIGNLPAGTYEFTMTAYNEVGVESVSSNTITRIVEPATWADYVAGTATSNDRSPSAAGGAAPVPYLMLSGGPPEAVIAGQHYLFTPGVETNSESEPVFMIEGLPHWASFDETSGELYGTPGEADVGLYESISIAATDGVIETSLPAFSIDVIAPGAAIGTITLFWLPPTEYENGAPLTDLAGYRIYWRNVNWTQSQLIDIDNPGLTAIVIGNLPAGIYEFMMTALNATGVESVASNSITRIVGVGAGAGYGAATVTSDYPSPSAGDEADSSP
jgi:hypothetical protein